MGLGSLCGPVKLGKLHAQRHCHGGKQEKDTHKLLPQSWSRTFLVCLYFSNLVNLVTTATSQVHAQLKFWLHSTEEKHMMKDEECFNLDSFERKREMRERESLVCHLHATVAMHEKTGLTGR